MSRQSLIVIDESRVKQLAQWDWIIEAVETAFVAQANKTGTMFPTVLGHGSVKGTIMGAKSGMIMPSLSNNKTQGSLGIKVGSYWPKNPSKGLPSHGSTTLLLDDETGFPKALINAHFLNGMRTAAANAAAVKYLSDPEATHLAIFGAGSQARFEVEALRQVRDIQQVSVVNRDNKKAAIFCEELNEKGLKAQVCDAKQAVENAQLITTVTASTSALFEAQWVVPGTHISAMGSDAPGKQETPADLYNKAALYCDNQSQSIRIGEFQYSNDQQQSKITELGAIIDKGINTFSADRITLFDSSGIGLQDVAVASQLLILAEQNNLIKTIDF